MASGPCVVLDLLRAFVGILPSRFQARLAGGFKPGWLGRREVVDLEGRKD